MSKLFQGDDPNVGACVDADVKRRRVLVRHMRTRRQLVSVSLDLQAARDLACRILDVCDYLDGAPWTFRLDGDGPDELQRALRRRGRR